jgi:hypothetical protein
MPRVSSSISSSEKPGPRPLGSATIGWRLVLLLLIIGTALYLIVFTKAVSKPLTNALDGEYLDFKTQHLIATAGRPRIIILAGSNGRYSHRCETIEEVYRVSCTNMSVHVFISLQWQLARLQSLLSPGDLLYMPLEYRAPNDDPEAVGEEAYYVARFASAELKYLSWRQRLAVLFYFDLRDLLSALTEMALRQIGVAPPYSVVELTPQGDERGHTAAKAATYKRDLGRWQPSIEAAKDDRRWTDVLEMLRWGAAHGVRVVGGLPTVFDGVEIPQELVDALVSRFRAAGGCFVVLDNKSRYPRSSFYNTGYHLNEEAQILHSQSVGRSLIDILHRQEC